MGTMALTAANVLAEPDALGIKVVIGKVTGSASYATGGDTIPDLSTAGNLGQAQGFTKVFGIVFCGNETAADDQFLCTYVPTAAHSPTAGKVKIRDVTAAADAEVAATTDLSARTFRFLIIGV